MLQDQKETETHLLDFEGNKWDMLKLNIKTTIL
jgi:hypothetical protein